MGEGRKGREWKKRMDPILPTLTLWGLVSFLGKRINLDLYSFNLWTFF